VDAPSQYFMAYADENLNINEVKMIVIGNKVDDAANRQVDYEKAKADYKDRFDIECFETSAKTGFGINESIMHLVESTPKSNYRHLSHE
jgi:GTPase Era involved in 16S rRNA processing